MPYYTNKLTPQLILLLPTIFYNTYDNKNEMLLSLKDWINNTDVMHQATSMGTTTMQIS